jgi:outer membrane receptor for ferrienterochelin and colicin
MNRIGLAIAVAAIAWPLSAQQANTPEPATAPSDVVVMEKYEVTEMKSFSDQAIPGSTPVAFTEYGKDLITAELGSRDLPLVLNTSPSVYASADSGGAGDARVNMRGFSQRNLTVMVNGVPIGDLENGWVYWSNWDGIGEVTSTVQVQRGLSNVTLSTPSIGGTMNIITDPAANKRGGSVKFEAGDDEFLKFSGVLNSGLVGGKLALTVGGLYKSGDGRADGLWTKGTGYYIGAAWLVNPRNRIEFYAIGAPQQHGQRFNANIAVFDPGYARSLGYTDADVAAASVSGPVGAGHEFNSNYGPVSKSYSGQQYYWGDLHSREKDGALNETVNYFHKPQINLNWYSTLSDRLKLGTVAYYSGGRGGGSGTLGSVLRYPNGHALKGNLDWDATIARNEANLDSAGNSVSRGILRNSVNNQDQFGVISKLNFEVTPEFNLSAGVDWRTAEIDHFREVRDLLGGDYYRPSSAGQVSDFWADGMNTQLRLGDKVDYYNTNTVDWVGLFVQGEYKKGPLTSFGTYGYSTISYTDTDHFTDDGTGRETTLDSGTLDGHQAKGGVRYAITPQFSAYGNVGWVSKVPIFDGVIDDAAVRLIPNPDNETFTSYETGVRWESADRKFNVSAGVYYTEWRDRTITDIDTRADVITYMRGVNANHSGVEIESVYRPVSWLKFDVAASFGDWYYASDVTAEAYNISTGQSIAGSDRLYLKDLKVGDAPQSQIMYGVTVFPTRGLSIKLQGRWYDRYWSEFDPASRGNANDRAQSWRIPSFTVYDLHANYQIPADFGPFELSLFAHVFNVFDEKYISDADDNSSYEGISSAPSHSAQRAAVFFGSRIGYNFGLRLKF